MVEGFKAYVSMVTLILEPWAWCKQVPGGSAYPLISYYTFYLYLNYTIFRGFCVILCGGGK